MAMEWKAVPHGEWSGKSYWAGAMRIDAYLVWADATGFADILRKGTAVDWLPLLIELREGKTASDFAEKVEAADVGEWLRVPEVYGSRTVPGMGDARYCTAIVQPEFFGRLDEPLLKQFLERFEMGLPSITPGVEAPRPAPRTSWNRPLVVVGTIDDNFAFAHARFREQDAATTRIDCLWTQDGAADAAGGFGYGREITGRAIDGWMKDATREGAVDEDSVYRKAKYADAAKRLAHGTHVLDAAAGEEPLDVADNAPRLVCVQFPERDNWGAMPLGVQILDGLRYILDRADGLSGYDARRRPGAKGCVVVNMPHANLAGPHDGSSILERAMDDLLVRRRAAGMPMEIVLPAGNNLLSRCHARFRVARNEDHVLEWRVLPDDATPNFLEIWLPDREASDDVAVHVTPPGGAESPAIRRGEVAAMHNGNGDILCTAVYLDFAANGDRPMILLAVAPTSTHRRRHGGTPAPCGAWKVRVSARRASGPIDIRAWIQRDDPVLGKLPYGRQSHFEHPAYVRFEAPSGRPKESDYPEESPVKRAGSINAIATGAHTVVIGGFRRADGGMSRYGGSGPEPPGPLPDPEVPIRTRYGPDASAVSDDSEIHRGVLAAGSRSSCVVAMNGTSVAVAQIVRWIAAQMQAAIDVDRIGTDRGALSKFVRNQEKKHQMLPLKPLAGRERAGVGRSGLPPVVKVERQAPVDKRD